MEGGARERKTIRAQAADVYQKYFSSLKKPLLYIERVA